MPIRGYQALVKAQSSAVTLTDASTTMTGTNTIYTITDVTKRVLDANTAVVVKVAGSPVTSGFVVDRLNGKVTFASAAVRTVTVSGKYVVLSTIVESKSFNFTGTRETQDITRFQQSFREYEPLLLTGTAELTLNYLTDSVFYAMLMNSEIKVLEYYPNDNLTPIRFYGLCTSNDITAPVEGIIEESISFQVTTQIQ